MRAWILRFLGLDIRLEIEEYKATLLKDEISIIRKRLNEGGVVDYDWEAYRNRHEWVKKK